MRTIILLLTLLILATTTHGQGACCTSDDCLPASDEPECNAFGGVFLDGEDCATDPCGPGACCFDTNCNTTDAFSCITAGREFAGAGTSCLDDPCESNIGACCLGATCIDLSPDKCDTMGGNWLGAGTNCGTGPCDAGSCCLPDDSCIDNLRHECDAIANSEFMIGAFCSDDPCAEPTDCPNDTLFAQQRDDPDDFIAGSSELTAGFVRSENFTAVAGPITGLTWWGFDLEFVGGNFIECVRPDPTFEIMFYEDAGGRPGNLVCAYTVIATQTPSNVFYLGAERNTYSATLRTPCVLVNGWVSIVGVGDPECWFLWLSSGYASPGGESWCDGCLASSEDFDLSLCLQGTPGGVVGACCDEADAICMDTVDIADCIAAGLRFEPDTACEDLDPACGVILGACCFDDATCDSHTLEDCGNLGGNWLGANTLCIHCPCITPCPAGAVDEAEPMCFDGYVDQFNAGCNDTPANFSPINADETVCGTSGVFNLDGENIGDWDWYTITIEQNVDLTWSANAEFPAQIWIVDGSAGCPGKVLTTTNGFECDDLTITHAVGPGTYWLIITPIAFTDESFCGTNYVAHVAAQFNCPADLDNSKTVDVNDLLTLLASWGACPGCEADLDNDNVVGTTDLLILLSEWGPCGR